ncbi:hypothetical protein COEX109129_22895 [Corallococcus exiguus]
MERVSSCSANGLRVGGGVLSSSCGGGGRGGVEGRSAGAAFAGGGAGAAAGLGGVAAGLGPATGPSGAALRSTCSNFAQSSLKCAGSGSPCSRCFSEGAQRRVYASPTWKLGGGGTP